MDCSGIYCKSTKHTCDQYTPLFHDITIALENTYYTITPEGYTFSGDNIKKYKCTVAISYSDDHQGLFILGDTFLRNFVSTFSYKNNTIVLGVNVNAPDGTQIDWRVSMTMIVLLFLSGVLFVTACFALYQFCCNLCKRKVDDDMQMNSRRNY